ncbi:MAG: isoprenyl transferase [Clostridium sp.]|jgi:undecaprenyl diphosphate synthase|nr:isoprenyl transferase [Clostridium sp.]
MFKKFSGNKIETTDSQKLDMERIPKHIGIIMDGNGRWAKKKKLPRTMGHRAGVETIRKIIKECDRLGVRYLTLYAFSTENWKRPKDEVSTLMNLLVEYLKNELNELHESGVVINYMGDITRLPDLARKALEDAKEKTKNNKGVQMNLALNYGGREDIIQGVKAALNDILANNKTVEDLTEESFKDYLYTKGQPDPELIIRPSGELRLSNFLLYQSAYSELWFSDINWPDFTESNLRQAIIDFQKRDRRFGGIKSE